MRVSTLRRSALYPVYFKDIFGHTPDRIPDNIYVVENDNGETVGFVSGHWSFDKSFYIEFAGILKQFRKGPYLRHLEFILDSLKTSFITAVDTHNTETMKILIKMNFIPIGFRSAQDRSYLEWMRGYDG